MAAKALRVIFIILNVLFWLIGLGLVTYVSWVFGTSTLQLAFISGTAVFTYVLMGVALLMTITGGCGLVGAIRRALCPLRTFMVLMVFLLVIQCAIAVFYQSRKQELKCCGFYNETEYGGVVDKSCYNVSATNSSVFQRGCYGEIMDWFTYNIPIWVTILVLILTLELVNTFLSCALISDVERDMRVGDSSALNKPGQPVDPNGPVVSDEPIIDADGNIKRRPARVESIFVTEESTNPNGSTMQNGRPPDPSKGTRWQHLSDKDRKSRSCWQWCKQDCMEIETVEVLKK